MIDIQILREDPERIRKAIRDKGTGDPARVDELAELDRQRRKRLAALQAAQARSNAVSKDIGRYMRSGRAEEAEALIAESNELKASIRENQEAAAEANERLSQGLLEIPNIPQPDVPVGRTPAENQVVARRGEPRAFDFEPLPHWELAEQHGLIDFERGANVSGAGFPFYRGKGARLQRALVNYFLDLATARGGYEEIQAPLLVNADSARGTGQLPDKEDLMYEVARDGLYLIPTAETPVTNLHRGEILDGSRLPIRYAAWTPCFRREAGSYGKDVRGLNRLHQFDKVELVWFTRPEQSGEALETLRSDAERPLKGLGLVWRVLLMCTGDMGFTQAKKYDLEVWSPGQDRWLEVSSISNFEDFQARRMQIRCRLEDRKKPALAHTLNGSGLALPRVVAALLEQRQQRDGSIAIPEALQPWTGFDRIG